MNRPPRLAVLALALIAAASLAPGTSRSAAAHPAPALEAPPGLVYDARGRRCRAELAPGAWLEGPLSSFAPHPDGLGFDFQHGDEQATLRFCPSGPPCLESLRGTLRASVPRVGFLSQVVTRKPPLLSVGLDLGANLVADLPLQPDLAALLEPDRKYVAYWSRSEGIEASIPAVPATLSSGGDRTTLVVGTDPGLAASFLYFEGRLPGFPFDGSKKSAKKAKRDDRKADRDAEEGTQQGDASESAGDAPEAAFAIVGAGTVPFRPVETAGVEGALTPFDGHLALRGPIQLDPLMVLDGEVVVDLDPDGDGDHPFARAFYTSPDLAIGGNGTLRVEIPFVSIPGLDLELGRASAGSSVSPEEGRIAFSGWASSENFLAELPIPIRNDGEVRVFGRLSSRDLAGSFLHAEGAMRIDVAGLGELLGLPLGDLLSRDAVLDANAAGITLQGTTESRLHPDIAYAGGVTLEVHVAPNGRDSYVELRGDVIVAGEGLENAAVRVSPRGMTVNGVFRTDLYQFRMEGSFSSAGYRLAGSAAIADPIELSAQESVRALDDVLQREEAQRAIEASLADARHDVEGMLGPVESALAAVEDAQAGVSRLQGLIDRYDAEADHAYALYRAAQDAYCAWWDVACQAERAGRVTYWWGQHVYWVGLREGLSAPKLAADGVLAAARAALLPLQQNLDAARSLVQVLEARLDDAIAQLAAARATLDSLPEIRGSLAPVVTVAIENGRTFASVAARFRGRPLAGGRVKLGSPGEACLTLPVAGAPELCAPL